MTRILIFDNDKALESAGFTGFGTASGRAMGIRFLCPNGHKLNVKEFLAGERGICPQCDAKFLVPRESGGQVEAIQEVAAVGSGLSAPELPRSSVEPPPVPSLPLPPTAEASTTEDVWYVRMDSGEQFGPASDEVMRGWVAEGRVPVESWVWRTGWPEWKQGGQAITLLNGPAAPAIPAPPALPETQTEEPEPRQASVEKSSSIEAETSHTATSPITRYVTSKRHRQDRARKATLLLGVLVLLLIVVLVVVLINN